MKKTHTLLLTHRKWLKTIIFTSIFTLLLFLIIITLSPHSKDSSSSPLDNFSSYDNELPNLPKLPRFAYLITGSHGDASRVKRLMQAVYHPRNYYVLHLDLEALDSERLELAKSVKSENVVKRFRNVMVMGKPDVLTEKGPTIVASTLHAVAVLLNRADDWDWFINLSASDYPLMPQDDLLHIFSYLPKGLNFIEHTSNIGWKEHQRGRPIVIDPGLYHSKKSGVYWAKEKRSLPASFKLFLGSEWVVLTKSFLEFCIWGWDNLPRTLLMYYTNFVSSSEGYYHTVVCNHKRYQNTTVNHDLRYMKWDNPPKKHPVNLTLEHFEDMAQSGVPFAREFAKGDPVLDKIDNELLQRPANSFTPGGWCIGNPFMHKDPCVFIGNPNAVKPTVNSKRLEKLILKLLDYESFRSKQCK